MERVKNILITLLFSLIIISTFVINLISPDKDISEIERRKLTKFPELNLKTLTDGKLSNNFEKYAADQFAFRDEFRNFKSFWSMKIFRQKDDNKMFEYNGGLYKIEYPLNEYNVNKTAEKIEKVYNKYLKNMNVYYSIIPDKNYYLENSDYPVIDYDKLKEIMSKKLSNLEYIDIFDELELKDFYNTDIHWKQENLKKVVDKINLELGNGESIAEYKKEYVGDFYGTYYGQITSSVEPDDMYILSNNMIESCSTFNYETQKEGKVYDKKETKDKYDIYLSGATPLIEINNLNFKLNRELIIFRDSFGSSIAPLFLDNYKKITLIDLRYMSPDFLENYVEFNNQDILFLYSSLVINQNILR